MMMKIKTTLERPMMTTTMTMPRTDIRCLHNLPKASPFYKES